MNQTLQNMLNSVINVGLKVLACLAILVLGWIIAKAVGSVVHRLLARVGFDRLAERTGLRRWTGTYEPSALIGKLAYYILLLFTFQLAFAVFGPNPISNLIDNIIAWLPRLIVACVIVVVAVAIANAVFDIVANALAQFPYGRALGRAAQVVIIGLGVIAALNQIGVATAITLPILITVLATIGGILIVGIGGGLIEPMRRRWDRLLNTAEVEGAKVSAHLKARSDADAVTAADTPGAPGTRGESFAQPSYAAGDERDVKPGVKKPTTASVRDETRPTSEL